MCGIVGVFNHEDAPYLALQALQQLQHRGEESCGISYCNNKEIITELGVGLIKDVFKKDHLEKMHGKIAIAHNRYSTVGSSVIKNAQPISIDCRHGAISVAHNGTLTNESYLKDVLSQDGSIFRTDTDTEVILHLFAKNSEKDVFKNILSVVEQIEGAFSLLILSPNQLIAVRDPSGFRPLFMGKISESYILASESCALKYLDAKLIRELVPGEIICLAFDEGSIIEQKHFLPQKEKTFCVFEFIYFARPDSEFDDRSVYEVRKELGRQLAKESYTYADIVISVPDSGNPYALGFARERRINFEMGLIRNHYAGRTFIKPGQRAREEGVKTKLSPVEEIIRDKEVVVIDDSIVRGTTFTQVNKMLRSAGAKKIHARIASPPVKRPCYYGIDTPRRKELIAPKLKTEEICKFIEADTLEYLSLDGLRQVVGKTGFCDACFSKKYPIELKLRDPTIELKMLSD